MNVLQILLLPGMLLLGQHCAVGFDSLLKADFAKNPVSAGWELRSNGDQPFDGGWVEAGCTPHLEPL